MPTAAKLVGAIFLALTAVLTTYIYDEITLNFQAKITFYAANAFLGFIVGWKVLGSSVGHDGIKSITAGLRAAVVLVFVGLASYSVWNVIEQLKAFYIKKIWGVLDGFMDSVIVYGEILLNPALILALVIGGSVSGIASGLANRFWS